ncbi:MAG: universal stress protein [Labilithrix sp.]|nr:universal stress protein [Labilithrix sp.]MCW5811194.1 universal stress protein [Labilithrix sp.]
MSTEASLGELSRAQQIASARGALLAVAPPEQLLAERDDDARPALVVVGAKHDGWFGGFLAEHAQASLRCPVLQVRDGSCRRYSHLVLATDVESALGEMLTAARFVAPELPALFLHAYDNPFEAMLRLNGASQAAVAHYRREAEKAARERVRAHMERWHLRDAPLRLVHGAPRFVLKRVPRRALLVIHRGRSRLKHMLFGSVTHWALEESGCDVLVV